MLLILHKSIIFMQFIFLPSINSLLMLYEMKFIFYKLHNRQYPFKRHSEFTFVEGTFSLFDRKISYKLVIMVKYGKARYLKMLKTLCWSVVYKKTVLQIDVSLFPCVFIFVKVLNPYKLFTEVRRLNRICRIFCAGWIIVWCYKIKKEIEKIKTRKLYELETL